MKFLRYYTQLIPTAKFFHHEPKTPHTTRYFRKCILVGQEGEGGVGRATRERAGTWGALYVFQVSPQGVSGGNWEGLRAGPSGLVPETVTEGCLRMIGKWARLVAGPGEIEGILR